MNHNPRASSYVCTTKAWQGATDRVTTSEPFRSPLANCHALCGDRQSPSKAAMRPEGATHRPGKIRSSPTEHWLNVSEGSHQNTTKNSGNRLYHLKQRLRANRIRKRPSLWPAQDRREKQSVPTSRHQNTRKWERKHSPKTRKRHYFQSNRISSLTLLFSKKDWSRVRW